MANYDKKTAPINYDEELAPNFWLMTYLMHDNTPIRTLDPDRTKDRRIMCDLQDRRPAPEIAALHYTERETVESFPDASFNNEEGRMRRRRARPSSNRRTKLFKK